MLPMFELHIKMAILKNVFVVRTMKAIPLEVFLPICVCVPEAVRPDCKVLVRKFSYFFKYNLKSRFGAVVLVKWSAIPTIRVRILLTPKVFSVKFVFEKTENGPGLAHFLKKS